MSHMGGTLSDQLLTCSSVADSHSLLDKNGAAVSSETCVSSWDEQHASWAAPAATFSSNSSSCELPAVRSPVPAALQSAHSIGPASAAAAAAAAPAGATSAALQPLVDGDSSNTSLCGIFSAGQLSLLSQLPQASQLSQGVKNEAASLCTAADRIIPVAASLMDPDLQPTWQLSPSTQQGAGDTPPQPQQQQQSAAGYDDATLDALLQVSAQLAAAKVRCGGVGVCGSPTVSIPAELSPNSSSVFNSDQVLPNPYGLSWQQHMPASSTYSDASLSPVRLRLLPLQQQLSGQQQGLGSTTALLSGELFGYGACAAPSPIEQQLSLQASTFPTLDTVDHTSSGFSILVGSHNDMVTLNTQQVTLHSGQYACSPGFSPDVKAAALGDQYGVGNDMAAVAAAVAHDKLAQMQRLEALQAQLRHEVAGLLTLI